MEQLVEYETAVLAKEKKFDWETSKWYKGLQFRNRGEDFPIPNSVIQDERDCNAPTQSELQRWLRENHRIHITIRHYTDCPTRRFDDFDYDDELGSYGIEIHEPKTQDECDIYVNSDFLGETYQEVLEIALKEGLKLIN